jgi:outer membrane protein assembly factor BamD
MVVAPFRAPAPLIYRPGEGWSYEPVGGVGKWQRQRAKEQMEVAQEAFDHKDYRLALMAARRVMARWGVSDYAPQAQFLIGRCYEERGQTERAFKAYQTLLTQQPKVVNYQEVLQRQYQIANLYLGGKWFKLWGLIPIFSSMEKTADMYDKIVRNGPYSDIAPQAQLKIGAAREKQKDYPLAAKAYELAADRYNDRPQVAAEALYREGVSYHKQALTAEYDQNTAGQAIDTFTEFMTRYPDDKRVDVAQKTIGALRLEQARGNLQIARFYEKRRRWTGALVYYNEVVLRDPESPYAAEAKQRITEIKQRMQPPSK